VDDFTTLFDFLPIGAYRTLPDGTQLRANAALVRLNGYDSEAELLAGVKDIALEWYVEPTRRDDFMRALDADGFVRSFVSEVYRHKTRERIWISENAHVVRDARGAVRYFEGTVEEITDRVRTESQLQRSEALLRQVASHVPGMVYCLRIDAARYPRFTYVSDGARDVLGVEPAELLDDALLQHALRHPDDRERVAEAVDRANRDGTPLLIEHRVVLRDGREKWVQIASSAQTIDGDGSLRVGVLLDVTDRHRAEALRAERDRAEASMRTRAEFLSRVSHELRTPMNAVLGFAQLLKLGASLPPREAAWVEQILASGQHLLGLLDDLLDLSGAQSGRLSVRLEDVDAAAVVRTALPIARAAVPGLAIEVTLEGLDRDPPWVRADPRRLRQVLVNLLTNAIKYGQGQPVHLRVRAAGAAVELEVADQGPGLSDAQLARLFQPFERLGQEASRLPGAGLGLALSRQLVESMGGTLEVHSRVSVGSRFVVCLPTAVRPSRGMGPPAAAASPQPAAGQ
jgi:PAS domain S-box-containing protein